MAIRTILFLSINFAGLALGGLFTGQGVNSTWYTNLAIAPWTPPGWVFGAAWTTIMICFAVFMAYAYKMSADKKTLLSFFAIQWFFNFAWNPVFFSFQAVLPALVIIVSLTILIGYFLFHGFSRLHLKGLLILPYFIWLCIAVSLNAYIYLKN